MLKYCKIIDDNTKKVSVGLGNNTDFYKSIGFEEREVVKVDDVWYLKGYEPAPNLDKIKEEKKQELKRKTEEKFYEKYPLYKQCNIAIYGTEEERQRFKQFHDEMVEEYDEEMLNI